MLQQSLEDFLSLFLLSTSIHIDEIGATRNEEIARNCFETKNADNCHKPCTWKSKGNRCVPNNLSVWPVNDVSIINAFPTGKSFILRWHMEIDVSGYSDMRTIYIIESMNPQSVLMIFFPVGNVMIMPDDVETNVTKALMVLAKDCHERIIIAGHSQGGAWAQVFASRLETSFIKKVYVVSTGAFPCFTNIEDAIKFEKTFRGRQLSVCTFSSNTAKVDSKFIQCPIQSITDYTCVSEIFGVTALMLDIDNIQSAFQSSANIPYRASKLKGVFIITKDGKETKSVVLDDGAYYALSDELHEFQHYRVCLSRFNVDDHRKTSKLTKRKRARDCNCSLKTPRVT